MVNIYLIYTNELLIKFFAIINILFFYLREHLIYATRNNKIKNY